MTNRPKAIGTAAEMAVVRFLEARGFEGIYRPSLQGINDLGDVHFVSEGRKVVISVKGGKTAERATPELVLTWLVELRGQVQRARGDVAFVVTKRLAVGAPRAGLWRAHIAMVGGVWSTDLDTMVRAAPHVIG